MKKFVTLLMALSLCSCQAADSPQIRQNSPPPAELAVWQTKSQTEDSRSVKSDRINYDTQKAVWISYIDLSKLMSGSEEEFTENITAAFDNVSELGCNTVYVHVRAFADAYYDSDYYVTTKYLSASYDPLEIMTSAAHEKGLSFHAWINPLRCDSEEYMEKMQGTQIYEWYKDPEKYPEYVTKPEGSSCYWLNPAYEEVRSLIADGAAEIARNYKVDGVHIDDYFYPTTDESFDKTAYALASTDAELSDWRLDNCSQMVIEMYSAVKNVDEEILFGVSPQGNLLNNYSLMYADVKKWCSEEGYLDYIAPQIYFGYENSVCPFIETLECWKDVVTNENVSLVCGLAVYKLDSEEEFVENVGIIARQIEDSLSSTDGGFALYSYEGLFANEDERFLSERESIYEVLNS